jgi:peptidoglycan/LPS O-acetylase OafA/YrhL
MTVAGPLQVPTKTLTDISGKPRLHLPFLDGLRGAAAFYVMLHHAWLTVWACYFPIGKTGYVTRWLAFGHVSVSVFIIISGFCLMLPVVRSGGELRGGYTAFIKRRARRILPPYYFAMALSIILILTLVGHKTTSIWDNAIPVGAYAWKKAIGTHLFLVNDFFDAYTINHVFWSVALEWQIYFIFPLLALCFRKFPGPIITTIGAVILSSAAQLYVAFHGMRYQQANLHYVGLFTMGMLAATVSFAPVEVINILRCTWPVRLLKVVSVIVTLIIMVLFFLFRVSLVHLACVLAFISLVITMIFILPVRLVELACLFATAGVITMFCFGIEWTNAHWLVVDYVTGLSVSCFLIAASQSRARPGRMLFSMKPLVWLGSFSYSLYLVHAPLLQVIWQYGIHRLNWKYSYAFGLFIVAGFPVIIGCAYLFFILCERPFLNTRPPVSKPV